MKESSLYNVPLSAVILGGLANQLALRGYKTIGSIVYATDDEIILATRIGRRVLRETRDRIYDFIEKNADVKAPDTNPIDMDAIIKMGAAFRGIGGQEFFTRDQMLAEVDRRVARALEARDALERVDVLSQIEAVTCAVLEAAAEGKITANQAADVIVVYVRRHKVKLDDPVNREAVKAALDRGRIASEAPANGSSIPNEP